MLFYLSWLYFLWLLFYFIPYFVLYLSTRDSVRTTTTATRMDRATVKIMTMNAIYGIGPGWLTFDTARRCCHILGHSHVHCHIIYSKLIFHRFHRPQSQPQSQLRPWPSPRSRPRPRPRPHHWTGPDHGRSHSYSHIVGRDCSYGHNYGYWHTVCMEWTHHLSLGWRFIQVNLLKWT